MHAVSTQIVLAGALSALISACAGCGPEPATTSGGGAGGSQAEGTAPPQVRTPVFGYEVVERYPHDRRAYTQGLLIVDGKMYESTGRNGESSVRLVDVETGEVLKRRAIDASLFGEGLASVGGLLYQLTWKSGRALLFDRASLRRMSYEYNYPGEGWGLTTSSEGQLVMSDGTATLRFLDPKGMTEQRRITVTDLGRPVRNLNELEWIDGEVWANVWKRNRVARIDPVTGQVTAWIDLRGLLGSTRVGSPLEDVLNGIAHDPETGAIYVTGKRWPYLFKIKLTEK
ncbi:glutaminyl-peptide cyclotransferase [Planctomycetota bacterium]|jgi:glutaminyl-peptide cyclotransferase|nr:glutaminyl-peptide cyclotransferase [Planctomycetota bacterium]MDB4736309.1 glutaminyl-peptide cyclotransferase [Planctomycetota bacterium]MDC1043728.1 glutaminyl-peptide cyclotransferase [bacterium]